MHVAAVSCAGEGGMTKMSCIGEEGFELSGRGSGKSAELRRGGILLKGCSVSI